MKISEKKIFTRTFLSSILLIISIVTYSVPWGHWAYTLDTCPGYNCGCILYGKAYNEAFAGGSIWYCQYVVITQIPIFLISAVLASYHGYRVFIKTKKDQRKRALKRNPLLSGGSRTGTRAGKDDLILDTVPADPEPEPPSYRVSLVLAINALLMFLLLLSVLVLAVDGFFTSCNQYRKILVKNLGASGNFADILNSRIQCPSIFDFLDYLQPDRKNLYEPYDYMRKDRINTGVSLIIGKFALTMNTMNWLFLSIFNLSKLKKNYGWCYRI